MRPSAEEILCLAQGIFNSFNSKTRGYLNVLFIKEATWLNLKFLNPL